LLQARENREWMCRSAWNMPPDTAMRPAGPCPIQGAGQRQRGGPCPAEQGMGNNAWWDSNVEHGGKEAAC
jgi:hypothetical protein